MKTNTKNKPEKKKYTLKLLPALILWGVLSLIALVTVFAIQQGSVWTPISYSLSSVRLLILNILPMAVMIGILWCLCGNLFYSGSITTFVWGLLSYVNLMKMEARGDPFVPGDFLLIFEGMEAVGNYEMKLHIPVLIGLAAVCGLLWLAGRRIRRSRMKLPIRAVIALVLAAVFALTLVFWYGSSEQYNAFEGPSRTNVPQVFTCFGFPYAFLYNLNMNEVDEPPTYSRQEAQGYEQTYIQDQTAPETAPNIIMIMCEAFTDLPNEDVFGYSQEDNPISFFNEVTAREDTVSGHMIVSNTGAGTANTEFDVLTGMMTNKLGEGTTSAFRVVRRNLDSVPRLLAEAGYENFFLHPGHNWFYNRESVYSYLGIEDQIFNDSFAEEDYLGNWISDEAFLRVLIEAIEERDGDAPIFNYSVTSQNHQAYNEAKYGYVPEAVPVNREISDEAAEYLAVYFKGLADSDEMLRQLTEYLDGQAEPYLLVFFGDHQPNLGGDYLTYRELGLYPESMDNSEDRLAMYTTPFLIWGNEAMRARTDLTAAAADLGSDMVISSHYLGALTCQIAGYAGWDGYVDYVNQLREVLPVCSVYGYRIAEGGWCDTLPEDIQAMEDLRWNWQYDRLKHPDVNTGD